MGINAIGGTCDCRCSGCSDCCSGSSTDAWYVDTTGAADGTCPFCDEAVAYVFLIYAVDGNPQRCEWEGTFGDTTYWTSSDACTGLINIDGFLFTWRLRFFVMRVRVEIACIDAATYGVDVTITQEWASSGATDPTACCGPGGTFGPRRAMHRYYAEVAVGNGECAAWDSIEIPLDSIDYEYWDTITNPLNPVWRPMTPNTYSPCNFPATITITAV